jgi:hypothetical protein
MNSDSSDWLAESTGLTADVVKPCRLADPKVSEELTALKMDILCSSEMFYLFKCIYDVTA